MQIKNILVLSTLLAQIVTLTAMGSESQNQEQSLPFQKIIGECWPAEDNVDMLHNPWTGEWASTKKGTTVHLTVLTQLGKQYSRTPEKTTIQDLNEEEILYKTAHGKKPNEGHLFLPEQTIVAHLNQNSSEENQEKYTFNNPKTLLPAIMYSYLYNKEGIFCPNVTRGGNGAIIFNTQDSSACAEFKKFLEKEDKE